MVRGDLYACSRRLALVPTFDNSDFRKSDFEWLLICQYRPSRATWACQTLPKTAQEPSCRVRGDFYACSHHLVLVPSLIIAIFENPDLEFRKVVRSGNIGHPAQRQLVKHFPKLSKNRLLWSGVTVMLALTTSHWPRWMIVLQMIHFVLKYWVQEWILEIAIPNGFLSSRNHFWWLEHLLGSFGSHIRD